MNNQMVEQQAVNTIRMLSVDAVEKAGIGHPGMPMGAAPIGYVLWTRHFKHNPANPGWFNRDRFVLSAGHGSMLLYSLLHLCGYDLPLEEIKQFRQWGSLAPGHPEAGVTPDVDATTGPLGQGIAMAVGMAIAEVHLGATYNRERFRVVDHYTFALCGDGDLMEGVSYEAASLAGHLKLGKLVVLYDSNGISLDGRLSLAYSEHARLRFEACGWQYLLVENENDLDAIENAIAAAKAEVDKPTLIEIKTTIGFGSPNKAGKGGPSGPHGTPLGTEEVKLTKLALNWPLEPEFYVPEGVREHFVKVKEDGETANESWNRLIDDYREGFPALARQFDGAIQGELPDGWDAGLKKYGSDAGPVSTRSASGEALNLIAPSLPTLIGGSADLETSTYTRLRGFAHFTAEDYTGRNINFGVREFAMAAVVNGMTLHGGVKAFGGTFLVFSDYLRPALRLGAIMNIPSLFVFTHDSIAVGEDGPTHQPIDQLPALRAMPDVTVIRPADGNETMEAWRFALAHQGGPVCLLLSRQSLPILEGTAKMAREGVARGAYVLCGAGEANPMAQIIASGSEVSLAVTAYTALASEGIRVRVISMPSWELFERQASSYRNSVILPDVKARLAVEAGCPQGWERYVGDRGAVIGINKYGASGRGAIVMQNYGFTVEHIVERVKLLLGQ